MVIEGHAVIEIDGEQYELGPNDTTWIAANVPHRFINMSPSKPMRIFGTYASIDATCTPSSTGIEHAIDTEHTLNMY